MAEDTSNIEAQAAFDKRTRIWRLITDRVAALADEVGGGRGALTSAQMVAIQRAAELLVLAGECRRKALRGEETIEATVRTENLAARALRAISLKPPAPQPSLKDYLARRAEKGTAA